MLIAGMRQSSETDGPGKRFVILLPGCQHHCSGCDAARGPAAGVDLSVEELMDQITFSGQPDGITITGGDPFEQADDCAALAKAVRAAGLTVLCQTIRRYEDLLTGDAAQLALLQETDLLQESGLTDRLIRARDSMEAGTVLLADTAYRRT